MSEKEMGNCISRHDNGTSAVTQNLESGKWVVRVYHENGMLKWEVPTKNELVNGKVVQWNSVGRELGSYLMTDGTGIAVEYDDNGSIRSKISMVSGKPNGSAQFWDEEGNSCSGYMIDGELVSTQLETKEGI